jgi:putative ABC transport system ATP-binding protein
VVAGIASPSSGKVCILGQDLTRSGDADRRLFRLKNIGFIFQNYYLLHSLTVLENAMLPLLMLGSTPEEAKPIASAFLEKVYLEGYEEAFPEELSFGEMQRVATVRALIHNPTVLICDEPTAALDQKSGGKVMEILQELVKEKGCTAIITTHDERILPYASSVFQMIDGKLYP